ncbi:MAG: hypothetical protein LBR10_06530 [Prevotellaceae bacterium]|jgi:hypothetical protein|nr:hypothetical protein [Prevotellaceae bacterium]
MELVYIDLEEGVNDEAVNFFTTVFLAFLLPFAIYLGFFAFERRKANNRPTIRYLGMRPRVVWAGIAFFIGFVVVFVSMYLAVDSGIDSVFIAYISETGIILVVNLVVNAVSFTVFKPRA